MYNNKTGQLALGNIIHRNTEMYKHQVTLINTASFSPGTPASSTTKTGHHDIAEILLKVTLNTKNQSINQ
jgi:hypothetical protein